MVIGYFQLVMFGLLSVQGLHGLKLKESVGYLAVAAGETASFDCSFQSADDIVTTIEWRYYKNSMYTLIWTNSECHNNKNCTYDDDDDPRFTVDYRNLGETFRLIVENTTRADAGTYACVIRSNANLEFRAELIILSEFTCGTKSQIDGVEEDITEPVNLTCSVFIIGTLRPTLEWWLGNPPKTKVTDTGAAVFNNVTNQVTLTTLYELEASKFHTYLKCLVSFPQPSFTDKKYPEYSSFCQVLYNISIGPKVIKFNPNPDDHPGGIPYVRPGDKVTCIAPANPPASYLWFDQMDAAILGTDTSNLTITEDMVSTESPSSWKCMASNTVRGKPMDTKKKIRLWILGKGATPATTTGVPQSFTDTEDNRTTALIIVCVLLLIIFVGLSVAMTLASRRRQKTLAEEQMGVESNIALHRVHF